MNHNLSSHNIPPIIKGGQFGSPNSNPFRGDDDNEAQPKGVY